MYNYFNCNVDFLIDHSAMVELEIVAIISRQKEKTLQIQPPPQKKNPKNYLKKVMVESQKLHQAYTVLS